ncbi:hypothetical protein [Burkholderia cepacia]|uniref:hypothetical protein n=1 Tax=Burkholderia cepacia TaxID=292 RepID=UPI0007566835|nr:hypothetical protein [Burkholderia cepacia]KWH45865.1 hypothetical protein WM00_30270 [Burkholderia cepacia]
MPNDNVLTDEQIMSIWRAAPWPDRAGVIAFARALLAAHPGQPEPRAEVTDDDIITACDAHGITLPVEALEAATILVNHFSARAGGT